MFSTEETQLLSIQWNIIVRLVRSYVRKVLYEQLSISESGNRYSFDIVIVCIHKTGVDVVVNVYDYYEQYWMLNDIKFFITWEQMQ